MIWYIDFMKRRGSESGGVKDGFVVSNAVTQLGHRFRAHSFFILSHNDSSPIKSNDADENVNSSDEK